VGAPLPSRASGIPKHLRRRVLCPGWCSTFASRCAHPPPDRSCVDRRVCRNTAVQVRFRHEGVGIWRSRQGLRRDEDNVHDPGRRLWPYRDSGKVALFDPMCIIPGCTSSFHSPVLRSPGRIRDRDESGRRVGLVLRLCRSCRLWQRGRAGGSTFAVQGIPAFQSTFAGSAIAPTSHNDFKVKREQPPSNRATALHVKQMPPTA